MFDQIRASSDILAQALDGLAARQRVTAHNLANVDTPGYQSQEVHFEAALQAKLQQRGQAELQPLSPSRTDPRHLSLGPLPKDSSYFVQQLRGEMRNDGNGVDLEQEMTTMAAAQVAYSSVSQMLTGRYAGLKYVITEGSR